MKARRSAVAMVAALGMVGAIFAAGPASAGSRDHRSVKVVASGLDGPFGLQALRHRKVVVAEGASGEVTLVGRHGRQRPIITGATNVAGVAAGRKVYAVLGVGEEAGGDYPGGSVLRSDYRGRHVKVIADLLQYELDNNPDGQAQFAPGGEPYEALSNPFSMTLSKYGLLVADGGGNDVLRVNPRTGRVSTFFVPPTITKVPGCLNRPNNPGTVGCDSVPTGVTVARGSVYVSTLGSEVPGAGRVYRLNARSGKVQKVWRGLTAPTGVAVSPRGTVYISQVLYQHPTGPPGRLTKIGRDGRQEHLRVTMPTGLDYRNGHLYASTGSIAGPGAGEIIRVSRRAFN